MTNPTPPSTPVTSGELNVERRSAKPPHRGTSNVERLSVAIIGGGIGGLASAWHVRERAKRMNRPVSIAMFESGNRWGGVIRSSEEDGFVLEHGPDSLIRIKPAGLELIRQVGLADQVQDTRPEARHSLIARGRRLIPVPEGLYLLAPGRMLPFALSPLISWPGKIRMGLDLLLPRRREGQAEESLAAFVRRRLGREALERIAQPMVGGIYTADPEQLSLAATMPQFLEMERTHRSLILALRARSKAQAASAAASGPRYGLFMSLRGGLQSLTDRLVERLGQSDALTSVAMNLNQRIDHVVRDGEQFVLMRDGAEVARADRVVVATPAHVAHNLLRTVDLILASRLATIPYAGVATVNLAFGAEQVPHLPQAAGFVVPAVERRTIIACTIASLKYAGRNPPGGVLLRAFVGGALHEQALELSDATLTAAVLADLRELVGTIGEPRFVRIHRWPKSMAQYVVGHLDMLRVLRQREGKIPGLALVGNGYEGVGVPDIVAQADRAADRLLS
jgi:oxygen-dependent protoporphyrinogen oxidase